jgi:hypothetical protein
MQIESGQKLHLAYEAGEGRDNEHLIKANRISAPICGRGFNKDGNFRMTINVPLGNACKNCQRVYNAQYVIGNKTY